MLLIPYLLGSYENARLCDLKKKKHKLFLVEIFYLTTSTPETSQSSGSCVTGLKAYNFRAERQLQEKKKKLTSPNQTV